MTAIRTLLAFLWANLDDLLFLGGLGLVFYGAETRWDGLGYVGVGLLLVLYVRPLKGWWMR